MKRSNAWFLCWIVLFFISGCTTLGTVGNINFLKSDPPFKTLRIKDNLTVKHNLGSYTFPSGFYKALYEDEHGYYYPSPYKICARAASGSALVDGGLYIKRGAASITSFYTSPGGDLYIFDAEIDQNLIQKGN